MIVALTILFILYEIIKIIYSESFINVAYRMKNLETKDIFRAGYTLLFFTELVYRIYTVALLFTSYWYVGLLLVALMIVYRKRFNRKAMISDGIISILVLSLVFIL